MSMSTDPDDTAGRLIAASRVNGTSVYDNDGHRLGSIHDVMLDKRTGQASYAIMSFGGFLGMGETYHPLPWSQLRYDVSLGGYVVNIGLDMLQGAPAYDSADVAMWDDHAWGNRVDDYYGVPLRGGNGGQRLTGIVPPVL